MIQAAATSCSAMQALYSLNPPSLLHCKPDAFMWVLVPLASLAATAAWQIAQQLPELAALLQSLASPNTVAVEFCCLSTFHGFKV